MDREPAAVDDIIAGLRPAAPGPDHRGRPRGPSPGFPLAASGAELRDATRALDPLPGGDLATDVRAVFSWSYRALTPDAAAEFRLLGLQPGPDISLAAAASLAAVQPGQARVPLDELTQAHLLAEHTPGRYACHDLLHAYAEEGPRRRQPGPRAAAVRRVLDHYLHTARHAAMLMEPHFDPLRLSPPQPGGHP